MLFDAIEWDDGNLAKTRRATATEVEQVIANADSFTRSRDAANRVMFRARTNGGRPLVVVAQLKTDGRPPPDHRLGGPMMDTTNTTNTTESELSDYYEQTGDLSEFEGGEVVKIEPGPKDSIVSVRFAAGELEAVERQAEEAGMKLTAFIRASALSGAQVVDLDRLRKVAAKLVADSQEMGKVVDLSTGRRTRTTTSSTGRTVAKSARTGRFQKSSRSSAASKAATKTAASKSTARPKPPPKGKA